MNFNYDLATWIEYFIGAFACCVSMFLSGKIILGYKFKDIKWYSYLLLGLMSILMIFNYLIFDSVVKVFGIIVILFVIYKFIFKREIQKSILYAVMTYFLVLFGEMSIALLMSLILVFIKFDAFSAVIKTILGNTLVGIFMCLYALILKNVINKAINHISNKKYISISFLGIISIFVLLSSLYKLYLDNWIISYNFILNVLIFTGSLILTIMLLKQNIQNKEITDKYNLLDEYLKNSAELIENYSSTVHKYKNNLIVIKGYLKTDMKEAEEYIDTLLEDYNSMKYSWFRKINYIQMNAVRYLIYYKLAKAENENLKIVVDVSDSIKKYNNKLFTLKENNMLLEIVGELFDNAIYASCESKKKEINLMVFEENEKLIIMLSNTYKGNVNLNYITKNGYTTKGKGHGLGLYDIDKSLRRNDWIKINYELLDDYFVAKITIIKEMFDVQ